MRASTRCCRPVVLLVVHIAHDDEFELPATLWLMQSDANVIDERVLRHLCCGLVLLVSCALGSLGSVSESAVQWFAHLGGESRPLARHLSLGSVVCS